MSPSNPALLLLAAALALAQGCVAPGNARGSRSATAAARSPRPAQPYAGQPAYQQADPLPPAMSSPASDDYAKATSAIEDLDVRVETLRQDLQRVSAGAGAVSPEDLRMVQDRMGRLEQQLADLKAGQSREQELLLLKVSEQVNKSMKEYLSGNPPPARAAASPAAGVRTPSSTGARTAPTAERGWEHQVEAGQTLSAIAVAYGTTTQAILKANNMQNADSIRVGQKLFIPATAP